MIKDTKCLRCLHTWIRRIENPTSCPICHTLVPNSIIDIQTGKVIQGALNRPRSINTKPMEEKQITQQEETKEIKDNTFKLRGPVNV